MSLCLRSWLKNINTRLSPFLSVLFVLVIFFLRYSKLFSVLAVLLLCFLMCCFGRVVVFVFCFLLCSFCSLSLIMCYFVTVYFCCAVNVVFVVFLGLLWVLLFSLCPPPVIMYAKQWLPCALPYPASPTFRFPPFHNTHMHPSNPCGRTCTLFAHTHMVMPVLVFVLVFVCLLLTLCLCVCLYLRLLLCLCLCFVFI